MYLNKRGGVLIGDVVGLGKTLMAAALARIFEDDYLLETLILCPKNLVPMMRKTVLGRSARRGRFGRRTISAAAPKRSTASTRHPISAGSSGCRRACSWTPWPETFTRMPRT